MAKKFKDKTTCKSCIEKLGFENLGKATHKWWETSNTGSYSTFENIVRKIEDNY